MSLLLLNRKCLDRWDSACNVSAESKMKRTWSEWRKSKYKVQYRLHPCTLVAYLSLVRHHWPGMIHLQWVAACQSWLQYWPKNLILAWIAVLSCAWTSIIGQEIPRSESCCLACNMWAVSQHLALWDRVLTCAWTSMICLQQLWLAMNKWTCVSHFNTGSQYRLDCLYCPMGLGNMRCWICHNDMPMILQCTRTSIIGQQKQQLCQQNVSPCLIFSPKYSISPRLSRLTTGIGQYAVIDWSW